MSVNKYIKRHHHLKHGGWSDSTSGCSYWRRSSR